ncbi:DUF748 domain-containing protein [Microbulbifer yueqingensis]|uniref:DUF748 domain-containing protein n=1 Tax=Microbulbifer yueqingensis TaxID=658219 RepID=A0A1G8Y5H9_9GAMM|nr:DUF748 domain-containing protein [Microbulbifer yueqingensis]SDJ98119.1 protein of unknown function [Microbulbifer yueqingensis]
MPEQSAQQSPYRVTQLLWLLVGIVVVTGLLSMVVSLILEEKAERWLEERGYRADIGYLHLSIPSLRLEVYNLELRNPEGRGLRARELMLDYSWWQLLRRGTRLQRAWVAGMEFDLQSGRGEAGGRVWEVAGWDLGEGGERTDRDLRLLIDDLLIRDSRLCYRDRDAWERPSCMRFTRLSAGDFLLGLERTGDEPLQVQVGAEELALRDLLVSREGATSIHTVVGGLTLRDAFYQRPGHRITATELAAERFASCLPRYWADAIPAFGRVVGHCGIARSLQLEGELLFSFGAGARVQWQRGRGEGVILRQRARRWPDWHAGTLSILAMDFSRADKTLRWREARASNFDWCPPAWRDNHMHACVRAGVFSLPDPTLFDWQDKLLVQTDDVGLQQVQLLDRVREIDRPLTFHRIGGESLAYRGETRTLAIGAFNLESATGCVPARLWELPEYCLQLAGLKAPEQLQFRFAPAGHGMPFGVASGPLRLGQFQLREGAGTQLEVEGLHWARLNLLGGAMPWLVQDFSLRFLAGCVPDALLPADLRPLCARARHVQGRGSFAWQHRRDGYLVAGELLVERLLLAEGLQEPTGLLLTGLRTGPAMLRLDGGAIEGGAVGKGTDATRRSDAASPDDDGAEKGLLRDELARRRQRAAAAARTVSPTNLDDPNLVLQRLLLARLEGCLPAGWAALFYSRPDAMPTCFDVRQLEQESELRLAWQGGVHLRTGAISAERAVAETRGGREILFISDLAVPEALVVWPAGSAHRQLELPGLSLSRARVCEPGAVPAAPDVTAPRCIEARELELGKAFSLDADTEELALDFSQSGAAWLGLLGAGGDTLAEVETVDIGLLKLAWSRGDEVPDRVRARQVTVAAAHGCLPAGISLRPGLPRCVSADNIRLGGPGSQPAVQLGVTTLKRTPTAEPLWQFDSVEAGRISLGEQALRLYDLEFRGVLACGMRDLLPEAASQRDIGDCFRAPRLEFSGVTRIGIGKAAPMVELAALESGSIRFWQETGDFARIGAESLNWQQLRWSGGTGLSVTGLTLEGFVGCSPEAVTTALEEVAEALEPRSAEPCVRVRRFELSGSQQLSLGGAFSSDGVMEFGGIVIGGREGPPLEIKSLRLDRLSYGGESPFISLAGASGCLSADWFPGTALAPCYELGPVRVERREQEAGTGANLIYGLSVGGGRFTQPGFPSGLPAELLLFRSLKAEAARLGEGEFSARALRIDNLAGCLPAGYVGGVDHCVKLDLLQASFDFRVGERYLDLAQFRTADLLVLDTDGRRLVRAESIVTARLLLDSGELQLPWLQAEKLGFLGRGKEDPEFQRHGWNGEVKKMRLENLAYSSNRNALEVGRIAIDRPDLILFRSRSGSFPVQQQLEELLGDGDVPGAGESQRFRYRLHHVSMQAGRFTWLDRQGQFRARVPIREIFVELRGISNHPEDDPATIVLRGQPGGFGKMQLAGELDYLDVQKWNASLTGYLENANLIPATPYIANLLGYKILQGQLDAIIDIVIHENKVDAVADIRLNKVRVRRVRDSDQLPVEESMIPLNVALYLLRDGQGDVRFTMPVTGNLYDPNFTFSFIFSDLLQRAILEALFSYFTPVGFYSLAQLAWQRLTAVHLDSIEFEPGSVELTERARRHLAEVVETLREKPGARPGICGIANARDWHALDPESTPEMYQSRRTREAFYRNPPRAKLSELERLARKRGRAVARYLIDAGITADKFIQCAPDYNGRDFSEPRVEFSS